MPLGQRMALSLVRLGFYGLATLAPRAAERKAAQLFATPTRQRKPSAEAAPSARLPFRSGVLALWQSGPAHAPLVLLVHGWQGHAGQFRHIEQALLARGLRVARFDQPAHGRSEGRRATIIDFRDAVLAVGRHLGPIHAVIGHSLGATACVLAMAQGLKVRRVVLLSAGREPAGFVLRAAQLLGLSAARSEGMLDLVRQEIGPFAALDIALRARERTEPVLVVHASDDRVIPLADGMAIAEAWPGAQFQAPAGLGHQRILRDPGVIQAAVDFAAAGIDQ